ncbi:MAG: 2-iminoacetate synthase ThiH [Candidatus Omnitrophica bacterium]|nr:2-iminoacetate synthase ThiH [Candidatus Omnitrophota bacterium]
MINLVDIKNILHDPSQGLTEELAQDAGRLTRQYFGRTITLYAPLYLSNFCSSYCTYCGFHSHNRIKRFKLTAAQMHQEMSFLAKQGIENVLLLTGESCQATPLGYLKEATAIAKTYFANIGMEVQPMEEAEYRGLFLCGVDGITVYQETYDRDRYKEVHIAGKKADYDYRLGTPERAAKGGVRHISMGILLGLADAAQDLHALYQHLRWMERNYPGVEYSVSFPRLRSIKGTDFAPCDVDDVTFVRIICLTRIQFPRVGINLSTRENPALRDHALELGITRISAGSNTSVGGYTVTAAEKQDPQFDVKDHRSVQDIIAILKKRNFDPVFTDWRRIENEVPP